MRSTGWRTLASRELLVRIAVTALVVGLLYVVVFVTPRYRWEWWKLTRGTRVQQFLHALFTTVWISAAGLLLSLALGVAGGLARLSRPAVWRQLAAIYVELVRGTPLLVQVMLAWYVASPIMGSLVESLGGPAFLLDLIHDPYVVGVAVLGIFGGAYVTEIVRAAIESIPRGQTEAALSQGMTQAQVYRYVILPQALRRMLPPLAGQLVSLVKDSSLLMLIPGVVELMRRTDMVRNSTQKPFEPLLLVCGLYFVVCFTLSQLARRLELRLAD